VTTIEGFDFFPVNCDDRGALTTPAEFAAVVDRVRDKPASDVVFIAHGFRNDENDATRLYTHFLQTLRANMQRPEFASLGQRAFVIVGVYWPSKTFREAFGEDLDETRALRSPAAELAEARVRLEAMKAEDAHGAQKENIQRAIDLLPTLEGNPRAQDEFVKLVLSLVDHSPADRTEGLDQVKRKPGSEVLQLLAESNGDMRDGTRGIGDVFGSIAGAVGKFLNLTNWYVMKDRSGTVGAAGVAQCVRDLRDKAPQARIHLVGHSLGGRLMAACVKSLCASPKCQPDSLLLLEAAFSHYGFSADNGHGTAGFFRDVMTNKVVKGPFLSTFSTEDTVVGKAYSIMSRLAGDNTREIGDASDEFGGIGRNGPLRTDEVATGRLHTPGQNYSFGDGIINSLDGSGGLIKNHSDVTNEAVTYAFASALLRT
jgi:hypothetical protein